MLKSKEILKSVLSISWPVSIVSFVVILNWNPTGYQWWLEEVSAYWLLSSQMNETIFQVSSEVYRAMNLLDAMIS